tara:strand:+ start:2363 stop:2695 length:333 start_codon:yes stop_codon:yes gene_type:complete
MLPPNWLWVAVMGFSSWNCKGCNESIKAPDGIPTSIAWQNQCVLLEPNGSIIIGQYDGYGNVGHWEYDGSEPEMWHNKCWCSANKPSYSGPSASASDQGYFYATPEDKDN